MNACSEWSNHIDIHFLHLQQTVPDKFYPLSYNSGFEFIILILYHGLSSPNSLNNHLASSFVNLMACLGIRVSYGLTNDYLNLNKSKPVKYNHWNEITIQCYKVQSKMQQKLMYIIDFVYLIRGIRSGI